MAGNLADRRNRFELLMKQAELPVSMAEEFFADGFIDQVECSRSNRDWTFYIKKDKLVPMHIYQTFCSLIEQKYAHIAAIHFVFLYSEKVNHRELAEEYWPLFLDWVQKQVVSVNGWMLKSQIEVENELIRIALLDETALELAKKKQIDQLIRQFYIRFFNAPFQVRLTAGESSQQEYERFAKRIEEEQRAAIQDLMAEAVHSAGQQPADAPHKLMHGYEIKDDAVPIQQIVEENKKATIQGVVFQLDCRDLKSGNTLFQFNLTDYTDSLSLKVFAKSKEEVKVLQRLKDGLWIKARGKVEYDKFMQTPELVMLPSDLNEILPPPERMDDAEHKRVEFHLHTSMSTMDGIAPVDRYIAAAAQWGHKAIAITDHAGVQAFPEAAEAAHKHNIKVIYGVEANVIDDAVAVVSRPVSCDLQQAEYVVFDIETTGLSVNHNKIIEIAGVKMKDGAVIDKFASFVNPHERIPYNITKLTNITDEMVADAPDIEVVLRDFVAFAGEAVLVAHNANFDMGFVQANCKNLGWPELTNPVLDTLTLARQLYPTMKTHRLNTLTELFNVNLQNHHRAVDDAEALGYILYHMLKEVGNRRIVDLAALNTELGNDFRSMRPFHCCIYALNPVGKKNLFRLISLSHTTYFNRVACIPKSKLIELREGLLIASGCEKGEFFETVLNKTVEEAEQVASFYDVLELQPLDFQLYLLDKGVVSSRAQLEQAHRTVCEIGQRLGKPVIATGNAHYLHPRDKVFRDITIHGITGYSPLKELRKPDAHYRTTGEMLEAFAFLGQQTAYEIVVENTSELADRFENYPLFPDSLFAPEVEGADEEIRTKSYANAVRLYGDPLPEIVAQRIEKELTPIIKYRFSANYIICERLIKKANSDGYLVGSRGSVGSSIVATLLGISEVNPLAPHFLCHSCKYSEWFEDGSIRNGLDLADKPCPKCGGVMNGDGQDIPFETFLGFKGDKVPDIDLNFSGDYQPVAHDYTRVLFGPENVFRAGTIGTVAEKTAYGYVKKYEEEHLQAWKGAELSRLANGCSGVKRNTGQHPGAIIVVPRGMDIEDITPVQFPADDTSAEWKTTHFTYHAYEANLLKLDILGHADPKMMKMLQDLTGVDPTTIPMNDPKVISLFNSTEALGVSAEQLRSKVATYGIPDFGSKFTRQMLVETQPRTVADLLQISGLSHGTGVWLGNAQELIRNATCNIETVIGCRDEIMLYLIYKTKMETGLAFKIMESVRRGRGLSDDWIALMKKSGVPQWYIDSCLRIEYLFPKAHAAAYVLSAVRNAYYKLYYPIEFYATYFSIRAAGFDIELFGQGYTAILNKIKEIEQKGFQATAKETELIDYLEMGLEMTSRGYAFKGIDLYRSEATRFVIDGDQLIPPFVSIPGVGVNAAKNMAAAREGGDYLSIEDFQNRAKASKTAIELLSEMGCFRGLPESNQLTLF